MRRGRLKRRLEETVDVIRQDPEDSRAETTVASGVKMIIQALSAFEDPTRIDREIPAKRFNAVVYPPNTAISDFDIVIRGDQRLTVVNVINIPEDNPTDQQLELEARE